MNERIRNLKSNVLSDKIFSLKEYQYEYRHTDKHDKERHVREVYDHGDGASVLLYNTTKKTVVLTSQFRLPSYLNGNKTGMLLEVCAGSLDGDAPDVCAKKEALEETGYNLECVESVFAPYASPATMTEIAHLFIAAYTDEMKVNSGGGLGEEEEYIDVVELDFNKAYEMMFSGEIKDARTIMLLQHLKIKNVM